MTEAVGERACPVCDRSTRSVRESTPPKNDMLGGRLRLATCDECNVVFQPVHPTEEQLANWYRYMGEFHENYTMTPLLERRLARIIKTFEPARQANRLLEVGCGGGLLLRVADTMGWDVYGTEISPSLSAMLRPTLGNRLWQGDLRRAPFPQGGFDVVVLMEIIEHLTSPLVYVEAVRKLLRPGGLFFLTTPNYRGLSSRVLDDRWRCVTDEHLNYFDASTIIRLLHRGGFEDVRVTTSNVDTAIIRELLRPARNIAPPSVTSGSRFVQRAEPPAYRAGSQVSARTPSATERTSAWAKDIAMEGLNRLLRAMRIGDSLKVVATAPEVSG